MKGFKTDFKIQVIKFLKEHEASSFQHHKLFPQEDEFQYCKKNKLIEDIYQDGQYQITALGTRSVKYNSITIAKAVRIFGDYRFWLPILVTIILFALKECNPIVMNNKPQTKTTNTPDPHMSPSKDVTDSIMLNSPSHNDSVLNN